MKQVNQRLKGLLFMLVMLCSSVVAFADETVEIDGVFYRLQDGWNSYYYDSNGNYVDDGWYEHAAMVVYDSSIDIWSVNNIDTYQGDIVIPETVSYNNVNYTVVSVDDYAFRNCKSLTSVKLPSSVVMIRYGAFQECSSLTSVTMPGVVSLSNDVFSGCDNLTTLNLPATLASVDSGFGNTLNLSAFEVDKNNKVFASVDGVIYNKDLTNIVAFPRKKSGTYTVPSTVTEIKSGNFPSNISLDELVIPATVTKIENGAFSYPTIKKLTIEDSDKELVMGSGNNSVGLWDNGYDIQLYPMFNGSIQELYWGRNLNCSSKYAAPFAQSGLNKVTFGANVTSVPKYCFYNCWSLYTVDVKGGIEQWLKLDFSEPYTSPYSSTYLGEGYPEAILTFNGSELSGEVVIPEGITSIPSHSFQYGCSGVTSLSIPAGVTTIADGAFTGLKKLKTISLAEGNKSFKLTDNVLYNNDVTKILCFPQYREGEYTVPSTITEIGDYQFYNCINLTGVTLPDGVKSIGLYAFAGCTKLVSVTIPSTVETIGNYAFNDCAGMTGFTLSNGVKSIGVGAFAGCTKLTSVTIPASVESIGDFAFDKCTGIVKAVFEDGDKDLTVGQGNYIEYNPYYSFSESSCPIFPQTLQEVYLGRNLVFTNPNGSPFACSPLNKVEIGSQVTRIPANTFVNIVLIDEVSWVARPSLNEVCFNGSIIDWCKISFENAYSTPFNNSNAILYLDGSPLHSQVNIPEGATKIGSYAFYGQHGVSTVIVPKTVKTIEAHAFDNGLISQVTIDATDVISLANANAFSGNTNIFIEDTAVPDYKADATWSALQSQIYPKGFLVVTVDLVAMTQSPALLPALNALEKVNGEYRTSNLTNLKIRGTMNGYDIMMIRNKMPNLRSLDLTEATILDNDGGYEYYTGYHTTENTISDYSFYNLTNLRSVSLPQNITSIGCSAFSGCSNLSEVLYIPESCESIGSDAFSYCSALNSIEISGGVKSIGYGAFRNCGNLRDITFVKGLETIEGEAFSGCGVNKLVFPTTLKSIGYNAFSSCSSLTDIDFAEGLTYIGGSAFEYCSSLKNLKLPTTLESIEGSTFNGCSNLSEVHVPSNIRQIGDYAFTNCGLKSVYAYTLVPIQINQNTFSYDGVDLYAPDNSFFTYYINTQWSQFLQIYEFPALYKSWYTPRDTDVEIDLKKPIKSEDSVKPADGELDPGSGLIINGVGEQLVKKLVLNWGHGDNYPSLIENGNLSVEELAFIMNVYPARWYFFSFPYDIKLDNIKHDGKWVWRFYDPIYRAQHPDESGWRSLDADVLKANVGYIFQCNTAGDLEIPVLNPEFFTKNGESGTASDKDIELQTAESENPEDASWNFVGNPNLSYYSLDDMAKDFTAPVTVWDDEQQTYTAVVPGDDDYDFHPFQAFFVQKPSDSDEVTFRAENRSTYLQAEEKSKARRKARARQPVDVNRLIVNVDITDGKTTDKTRVVFDDSKSLNYEVGTDASKMMSMAAVPQIYTLDVQNSKYAVNTRPNGSHEVRLGVVAPSDGEYSISIPRMDYRMALKDNVTGIVHDFSTGSYTFQAEAGTIDDRFTLVAGSLTGITESKIEGLDVEVAGDGVRINGIADQPVSLYNLKGVRVASLQESGYVQLAKGTYIVSMGGKNSKVSVK